MVWTHYQAKKSLLVVSGGGGGGEWVAGPGLLVLGPWTFWT